MSGVPGQPVEVVLDSGAKFVITRAPHPEALALHKAILRAMEGAVAGGLDLMNMDAMALMIRAATSDEVERTLYRCWGRCAYEGNKVNEALFDDPRPEISDRAREDYYQMAAEAWKVNCLPFLRRIPSWSKELIAAAKAPSSSPASPSA